MQIIVSDTVITSQTVRRVHIAAVMRTDNAGLRYADAFTFSTREGAEAFMTEHGFENVSYIECVIGQPADSAKPNAVHVAAWPAPDGVHAYAKAYSSLDALHAEFPQTPDGVENDLVVISGPLS